MEAVRHRLRQHLAPGVDCARNHQCRILLTSMVTRVSHTDTVDCMVHYKVVLVMQTPACMQAFEAMHRQNCFPHGHHTKLAYAATKATHSYVSQTFRSHLQGRAATANVITTGLNFCQAQMLLNKTVFHVCSTLLQKCLQSQEQCSQLRALPCRGPM